VGDAVSACVSAVELGWGRCFRPFGRDRAGTPLFASELHRRATAQPQEAHIATPYDARIDQALRSHKRQSRMVSLAIIGVGLLVLAVVLLMSGGRRLERTAMKVEVGEDTASVIGLMGAPPHRCEPSSLAHLATQFPAQTPRPTIEDETERLRRETVQRWLYPEGEGCVPGAGAAEIGLDRAGRVLWIVPARDKRPLEYQGAPT
jgi:hypothetical protein